jgi:rRNA-processing protein FCF1
MTKKPRTTEKRLKIILDSNAFFVPFQFNIDIFEELQKLLNRNFDLILIPSVKKELETIASQGRLETKRRAVLALQMAEKCTLLDDKLDKNRSTDDLILRAASRYGYPVFTNDRELRDKLRDINVPVIYVRQKSRLATDGRL